MIYVVTNGDAIKNDDSYTFGTFQQTVDYLTSLQEICLDAETYGFDPHTKKMVSLQVGDYDNQFVIDCKTVDIKPLKTILESRLVIGQNLKFDAKFLFNEGIILNKIYDTFVAEKVLTCGYDYIPAGLDALAERYAGIIMDKSIRGEIGKEGLSPRVIRYGADDIKCLPIIKKKQLEKAKTEDLIAVINLENRFTPCLAYIEWCGFKLDAAAWKTKMDEDFKHLAECEAKLNEWVLKNEMHTYIDQQLDMFTPQGCTINWSSPKQVIEIFEELGIKCEVYEKGKVKKSVEASVIAKYAEDNELIKLYLEYKKADKVVSTYGENFLAHINPVTGRVHTNFKQVLNTGRISSGGRDSDRKVNLINFQNIPADAKTRACFVAEPGNTLIICDYSGQEQIILANKSLDENLLKFYDEGLADMHAFVASKMYPELEGLPLEEIKTKHKKKRQAAKAGGFAISYGGTGKTIAENLNIPEEEGNKIYDSYFVAFPGLKEYFNEAKQQGLRDGYILISEVTKRKSYIPFYEKYIALDGTMTREFWTKYRKMKGESERAKQRGEMYENYEEFKEMRKRVREYFGYKGDIERKSLNFPIQGAAAEIMKIACVYIYDWILKNNYWGIIKLCNTIHDELVPECPTELAEAVAPVVKAYMEKAGTFYCKRVPLTVDPEVNNYWKK